MAGIEEGSWPGTELIITFVIEDIHIPYPVPKKTSKEKANSESSTSINQVSHRSQSSKIHDLL